jgi:hypothetical protein
MSCSPRKKCVGPTYTMQSEKFFFSNKHIFFFDLQIKTPKRGSAENAPSVNDSRRNMLLSKQDRPGALPRALMQAVERLL